MEYKHKKLVIGIANQLNEYVDGKARDMLEWYFQDEEFTKKAYVMKIHFRYFLIDMDIPVSNIVDAYIKGSDRPTISVKFLRSVCPDFWATLEDIVLDKISTDLILQDEIARDSNDERISELREGSKHYG